MKKRHGVYWQAAQSSGFRTAVGTKYPSPGCELIYRWPVDTRKERSLQPDVILTLLCTPFTSTIILKRHEIGQFY
jgi:hypothetical protein